MKSLFSSNSLLIILIISIFSCKKSPVNDQKDVGVFPSQSNEIAKVLVFPNSLVVDASELPASTSSTGTPVVTSADKSISYSAGSKIIIPADISGSSKIKGVYIQVTGARTYSDVPLNINISSGTVSIPFDLPSIVNPGVFTLTLKFYDVNNRISSSHDVTINVTKADNCGVTKVSGGQGLTSNIFKMPNTAGSIKIDFNTFVVKDKIDVFQNGTWIGGTGPQTNRATLKKALTCAVATESKGYVGKDGEFIFKYNPDLGTDIEVVVSGCEDGGTAWEYTFSCPGDYSYKLDGKWLSSNGTGILISGSTGKFYALNSLWLSAKNQGLINLGSEKIRNISKVKENKWSCQELWVSSSGGVAKSVYWSNNDGTITMSADGKTLTNYSSATRDGKTETGTVVYSRQSN